MSDETPDDAETNVDVTRPRPRPRLAPVTEPAIEADTEPDVQVEAADPAADAEPTIAPPPSPISAASRARRIGGRPIVPAPPGTEPQSKRPSPPPPGTGRHLAPPPVAPAKEPKPRKVKEQKPPKEPRTVRRGIAAAWVPAAVLGVAALVLVVLIGVASHGVYWSKSGVSASTRNTTQQAALASAKSCIATINTYDYRKLSTAEAAALSCTTGKFTSCLKSVYTKTLEPKAPVAKAVQTAQVNQAGIRDVSSDGKQIDILTYGQLTLTNVTTSTTTPQYDPFGAIVTMNKVGDKWLVSKIEADVGGSISC